ncbi:MAG: histidine kinase N-terminal 7TM domain-containing protein [Burkholderiaceae bacterium]
MPLASLVVVWGGSLYELMIRSVSFSRVGMLTYVERIVFGPFYWLFVAQGYLIVFLCVGLILAAMRRAAPLMRAQALALLAGILLPSVANLLLITGAAPRQFDPMPLGIALAAATLWWASMRHRILDLVPVVRSEMVDVSTDGMLALDAAERVIDANPAMAAILGHDANALVGMPLLGALRRAPALMQRLLAEPGTDVDADATVDIGERAYALRVVLLGEPGKLNRGRLVALHDVTERRRLARERERLIDELRGALAEVRTLSGLLPVCAGCKQIRTEAGGWLPIDDYIAEHSEAQVSHTICPDCQSRFYPDTEAHGG